MTDKVIHPAIQEAIETGLALVHESTADDYRDSIRSHDDPKRCDRWDELVNLDTIELLQRYLNAQMTYYTALGHNKTAMNECEMRRYADVLLQHGVIVALVKGEGIFNGVGAV